MKWLVLAATALLSLCCAGPCGFRYGWGATPVGGESLHFQAGLISYSYSALIAPWTNFVWSTGWSVFSTPVFWPYPDSPVAWLPVTWQVRPGNTMVHFSFWPLLLLSAALTVWFWTRTLQPGACPRCGYDLTGNVSGRCPECGNLAPREPVPPRAQQRRCARSQLAILFADLLFAHAAISWFVFANNRFTISLTELLFLIGGAVLTTLTVRRFRPDSYSPPHQQPRATSRTSTKLTLLALLILLGHLIAFPLLLATIDWWLGYGAHSGFAALPAAFSARRFFGWFSDSVVLRIVVLLIAAGFGGGWLIFRVVTWRRPPSAADFLACVVPLCRLGLLLAMLLLACVAAQWLSYDTALMLPLLWVLFLLAGPAIIARRRGLPPRASPVAPGAPPSAPLRSATAPVDTRIAAAPSRSTSA